MAITGTMGRVIAFARPLLLSSLITISEIGG
ncbi:hypothetical protein SAMN05216258_1682 [Albimonas pacifica]|uniref:Uncharacterized protein n=1 Tax=Albimonas pacifica TaxID=1114924 RepID=A0A1I3QUF4_9RHOB|nr:hypothetical protein SAMN05216258_1682 [Albimonas pacifica]